MEDMVQRIYERSRSLWQSLRKRLGRSFSFSRRSALPVVRDGKTRPIINSKVTAPRTRVYRPIRYTKTRAEAISAVVRKNDYINVRPPRVHRGTGGEGC
jgi:hypothetical protein